jgi:hypothetical protein
LHKPATRRSRPAFSTNAPRQPRVFLTTEASGVSAEKMGSTTITVSTAMVAITILAVAFAQATAWDTVAAWDAVEAQGMAVRVHVGRACVRVNGTDARPQTCVQTLEFFRDANLSRDNSETMSSLATCTTKNASLVRMPANDSRTPTSAGHLRQVKTACHTLILPPSLSPRRRGPLHDHQRPLNASGIGSSIELRNPLPTHSPAYLAS